MRKTKHDLEHEITDLQMQIHETLTITRDLVGYLNSEKFWVDTSVQSRDVLARIQPIISKLME